MLYTRRNLRATTFTY